MQIVSVYFFVIETCNMIQHYILIDLLDFKRKKIEIQNKPQIELSIFIY